jgi:hypothetical protein
MAGDVPFGPRAVRPLDGIDSERQVPALIEDARVDDPFGEVVGGVRRGIPGSVRG